MGKMKSHNNKEKNNKLIYIGNYTGTNDSLIDKNDIDLQHKVDVLTKRLNFLESTLRSSKIIQAKPVLSIVWTEISCLNRINNIYEKWIKYISTIANSYEVNYDVGTLFWQLDYFIFDQYFSSLTTKSQYILEFVNVSENRADYTDYQWNIVVNGMRKNRNENFKLLHPHHKEYISVFIENNRIFLLYFQEELSNVISIENRNIYNNTAACDLQFTDKTIHPQISLNNDVTGDIEINNITLRKKQDKRENGEGEEGRGGGGGRETFNPRMTTEETANNNDIFEFSNLIDKRQLILQNKQPLYNTLVDMRVFNKLNSTLFRFNPALLNLSLIIFHAMLHIKRDIDNDNTNYDSYYPHDSLFTMQYISFTPSALYGHTMLPPLTL